MGLKGDDILERLLDFDALKELRESYVWLDECDQLIRILARSILTAKRNSAGRDAAN